MTTFVCGHCEQPFVGNTWPTAKNEYCSENCRKRGHEHRQRAACQTCGSLMGAGSGYASHAPLHGQCQTCWGQAEAERVADRAHQVERWWAEGLSMREIAKRLGWTRDHLSVEMDRMRTKGFNLPLRKRARLTRADVAEVEQLWADGLTCRGIMEALGLSPQAGSKYISWLRHEHGADLPYRRQPKVVA